MCHPVDVSRMLERPLCQSQVVVKSLPNTAAVDLESVLFLEKGGRALGRVFDVFGPVSRPFYAVRYCM